MIIAIDFDGTIVTHEYPRIGEDLGAIYWMKLLQGCGARLILLTMREGQLLGEAVQWCRERGVEFWGVNENPTQNEWAADSRKVFANVYVDDAALGCPAKHLMGHERQVADWQCIGPMLVGMVRARKSE